MKAVIIYSRGKDWLTGKPHWEQKLVSHRHYLVDTLKDKLVSAGPFMDHTGGLIIVEVESLEEVAKNDPAVLDGKFEYVVHPWEPLEGLFTTSK
ncbi:YciI family protein [Oceanihabitans sediminis]|uniref:YciI family protein n=1 Tax=Oceanihabitans sediminis TaxID=1812012 RepID=UPI00299ED04A|nr:YciI family protein [Oceanihabitans sediminis]MDX1774942.1 YciI family protein [Oceanihabitans sediminis]